MHHGYVAVKMVTYNTILLLKSFVAIEFLIFRLQLKFGNLKHCNFCLKKSYIKFF